MSDALPLLPHPDVDQYQKLAKDLKHACESSDEHAVQEWARRWVSALATVRDQEITVKIERDINRQAAHIERRWREWRDKEPKSECRLTDTQFFIAREHGFTSWPNFAAHIEALARAHSPVSDFEAAADAIVNGDATMLATLLRQRPDLVHQRSTRDHRSTLLHYVSANGIEDFRQKTPKNIVEITRMLLDAGADVNAESDAYSGGSTTLGLTATSIHPERAGVQIPLLELLLDRGSRMDQPSAAGNWHSVVAGCFANGQPGAARYLIGRGAPLDLESAAALGDLAFVQSCFDEQGGLKPPATERQMKSAFVYACGYGREPVVRYFLQRGIDVRTDPDVRSSLPWAVYGGRVEVIRLLLEAGADVNLRHAQDQVAPLEAALGAWAWSDDDADRETYYEVVRVLVAHGATLDTNRFKQDDRRQEIAEKVRADSRMLATLGNQSDAVADKRENLPDRS